MGMQFVGFEEAMARQHEELKIRPTAERVVCFYKRPMSNDEPGDSVAPPGGIALALAWRRSEAGDELSLCTMTPEFVRSELDAFAESEEHE